MARPGATLAAQVLPEIDVLLNPDSIAIVDAAVVCIRSAMRNDGEGA